MDHFPEGASGTCPLCSKSFASTKLKNRHIKRVHQTFVETQENLRKHLVVTQFKNLNFNSRYRHESAPNVKVLI
jgi:hypothetical protein